MRTNFGALVIALIGPIALSKELVHKLPRSNLVSFSIQLEKRMKERRVASVVQDIKDILDLNLIALVS